MTGLLSETGFMLERVAATRVTCHNTRRFGSWRSSRCPEIFNRVWKLLSKKPYFTSRCALALLSKNCHARYSTDRNPRNASQFDR